MAASINDLPPGFEIETEQSDLPPGFEIEQQPKESIGNKALSMITEPIKRTVRAGPASFNTITGGPQVELMHNLKSVLGEKMAGLHPVIAEALSGATDPQNILGASMVKTPNIGGFVKSLRRVEFDPNSATEAASAYRSNLRRGNPLALRQAGIDDPTISKIQSYKGQYGAEEIPTVESAGSKFQNAEANVPDDFNINVKPFKGQIGALLRNIGIIDERGQLVPGITKDSRAIQGITDVYKNLKSRIYQNEKVVPKLLDETVGEKVTGPRIDPKTGSEFRVVRPDTGDLTFEAKKGLNQIIRRPDSMDLPLYRRTKAGLQALLSSDEQANIPVYRMIDALDTAAEKAGLSGLREAKTAYSIAKSTGKARNIIDKVDTGLEQDMNSLIKQLESPDAGVRNVAHKVAREKLGDYADSLIETANKRVTRKQNIGKLKAGTGIALVGEGLHYGSREIGRILKKIFGGS